MTFCVCARVCVCVCVYLYARASLFLSVCLRRVAADVVASHTVVVKLPPVDDVARDVACKMQAMEREALAYSAVLPAAVELDEPEHMCVRVPVSVPLCVHAGARPRCKRFVDSPP